jgi:ribonuclease PH
MVSITEVFARKRMRPDRRKLEQLRPVKIRTGVLQFPQGSAQIDWGLTRVLCTATALDGVPKFLMKDGAATQGWLTAEYAMLPGSTPGRKERESARGKLEGRTQEIQRLIGRAMRAAVDMTAMPGYTIWLDCDVLQADGGTRTASITGAYVALAQALHAMQRSGQIKTNPLRRQIAAVSVGVIEGQARLDLCYKEDVAADVDMNVVMTADGKLIEVQGTAEHDAFSRVQMTRMISLAAKGCAQLFAMQRKALGRMLQV